ncbi:coagulation factor XIII A chain-like [Polymixia lowei]
MVHLGSQNSLRFVLTGHSGDQSLSAIRVVTLQTPTLIVTVSGVAKIGREMFATVTFTNPFSYALENVYLAMEGPGLLYYASRKYSLIPPMASITWTESFIPRILGSRRLIAALDCSLLRQVWGTVDLIVI